MTFLILNPNSTASMTDAMVEAARLAAPGRRVEGWTSHEGPPAIQGADDGEAARAPLLELVDKAVQTAPEGLAVGCFDDTALAEVRTRADCPVVGLGQASYVYCALRGWRFSVVTTLPVSVPIFEENIHAYGLGGYLGRVRASAIPVLELDAAPEAASVRIHAEASRALAEDGIDAVVLGCAGMVAVTRALRSRLSCPVVDPVEAAVGALGWLA